MITHTAADLSSLTSSFGSVADGDIIEISADITLSMMMCVLLCRFRIRRLSCTYLRVSIALKI